MSANKSVTKRFCERETKIRQLSSIVILFVYLSIVCNSITEHLFWADDPDEMDFVRNISSLWDLFGHDVFQLFRPVKNLLWFLFSQLEPHGLAWCHGIAITIGIFSFFAILYFFQHLFESPWKAFFAASIWLLSPTLVSSVAWLSCLNIQVMVAFATLAIVFHDKAWDDRRFRPLRVALACIFLSFALVSYECAVSVVPILIAFDWLLRPGRLKTHRAWMPHACYWIILFLYIILRHLAGAKGTAGGRWIEATRGQLIVSSPWFAVQHLASWFWPFGRFSVGGSYVWGEVSPAVLAMCAVAGVAVLALAFALRKRRPALSFSVLFAVLALAPVCNCLGFGNGPYGDYYLTLASVGIAAGCVEIAWWLAEANGRWRVPAYATVGAFAIVRAVAVPEAARWAHLWTRYDLAYAEAARNYPDSLQNQLGSLRNLVEENRWDEALEVGNNVEKKVGSDSFHMGGVYYIRLMHAIMVTEDKLAAYDFLNRCASVSGMDENDGRMHYYRGCILKYLEMDEDSALEEFERALSGTWKKALVPCALELAQIKAKRGELGRAISLLESAKSIAPEDVSILWSLANAYRDVGNDEAAEPLFEKVRRMTGNQNLGWK